MKWQDDLNLVGNLDKLCKEAEKIKMVHTAAYMVTGEHATSQLIDNKSR